MIDDILDAQVAQIKGDIGSLAKPPARLRALTVAELLEHPFKERTPLLRGLINAGDLLMLYGPSGLGKTQFTVAAALAVASGSTFGPWTAPQAKTVLYVDGELQGKTMLDRIALQSTPDFTDASRLRVFTPELLDDNDTLPDLATLEGQMRVSQLIKPTDALVVIDNLSAWNRAGIENDGESWLCFLTWLLDLRRKGHAVLMVHHAGKSGQQRGTSRRIDALDTVLKLSAPDASQAIDDDRPDDLSFKIEFEKHRHLLPHESKPLHATMTVVDGSAQWSFESGNDKRKQSIVDLLNEGLSQSDIARELGLNRSTVSRAAKKAGLDGISSRGIRP